MASTSFNWKQCFDQVAPNLILYARQIAPTPADAEDVVQMAFVRWWRRFPEGDSRHIPLLYAAVRTIALDLRRSQQRRAAREARADIATHPETPAFDPPPELRETAAIVEQALARLPEEQREVVTLRLWAGLTFAQIAATTKASINTVAGRYRYALATLQKHLAPLKDDLVPTADALPGNILPMSKPTEVSP